MDVATTHHSTLAVGICLDQLFTAVQSMALLSNLDKSWEEPTHAVLNIVAVVTFEKDLLNLSCSVQDSNTLTHFACKQLCAPGLRSTSTFQWYLNIFTLDQMQNPRVVETIGHFASKVKAGLGSLQGCSSRRGRSLLQFTSISW